MMSEETITGLEDIDRFIRQRLRQQDNALFLHFAELIPTIDREREEEIPLIIYRTALEHVTGRFIRQLRQDATVPEVDHYYTHFNDPFNAEHDDPKAYYPPNSLAVLLHGIREFSSTPGITPEQEEKLKDRMQELLTQAAKAYAHPIYVAGVPQRPRVDSPRMLEMDIVSPAPRPQLITGLKNIGDAIRQRLIETRNRQFIGKASLTPLKPLLTLEGRVGPEPEANLPGPGSSVAVRAEDVEWHIDKRALAALTDRFVAQLRADMEYHEPLFADKPFSPAALAILLFGIEHARRKNTPGAFDSLAENIRHMGHTLAIGEAVEKEAATYAHCIHYNTSPGEMAGFSEAERVKKDAGDRARRK